MKKGFITVCILVFCAVIFVGCQKGTYKICQNNISEYRACLFLASCESFNASFTSGKREDNFRYDGQSDKLVPYGVLTIRFNYNYYGSTPNYVLYIDSLQYSGFFERNPYDGTYVADIEKEISEKCDIYLRVHASNISKQMNMNCISSQWSINYTQAFNIAVNNSEDVITPYINGNQLNGEFFIKIVGDTAGEECQIYWYIYFVAKDKKSYACIIDVNTGEIVSQKHIG